ncbi:class I SAM-dependent methyltransferase [Oleidesulfovibrio sp.]|uniref:class I SAM-dependent methyltransferase n=1 Tax=Oleidesulfovibrio sp. TaxID=2909707 RepID=UPI003A88C624
MSVPRLLLLKSFLRAPSSVGSIWPSSSRLCNVMAQTTLLNSAESIVELGPGSGAITRCIARNKNPDAQFISIEKRPQIYSALKKSYPEVHFENACATHLPEILCKYNMQGADMIISSLPWSTLTKHLQNEILESVTASLNIGGIFLTYAYISGFFLPHFNSFRSLLHTHFSDVETTRCIWRNIPPAFVYTCNK